VRFADWDCTRKNSCFCNNSRKRCGRWRNWNRNWKRCRRPPCRWVQARVWARCPRPAARVRWAVVSVSPTSMAGLNVSPRLHTTGPSTWLTCTRGKSQIDTSPPRTIKNIVIVSLLNVDNFIELRGFCKMTFNLRHMRTQVNRPVPFPTSPVAWHTPEAVDQQALRSHPYLRRRPGACRLRSVTSRLPVILACSKPVTSLISVQKLPKFKSSWGTFK